MNFSIFTVFLKNRNIVFKIKISKVTDYAALKHALLYSFIVFKYVILILRKYIYILGRIGLYFWGFWEKRNFF